MKTNAPETQIDVCEEIEIKASVESAFAALLDRLGPHHVTPDGKTMSLKLEAWPGGRWFRDLGDNQGHLWGHVQVVKTPTILEIVGPLFMSYPVISHLQFRISEADAGALLSFHHQAIGLIDPSHSEGVRQGWTHLLKGVKNDAEY